MGKYDSIINLPHPEPPREHPRMSIQDRAAQFIGFRALTGHEALLSETARYVDQKIELDEMEKENLDRKIMAIVVNIGTCPPIRVKYFIKDNLKTGGKYVAYTGLVEKVHMIKKEITFFKGPVIKFDDIVSIEGDIFNISDM